MKPVGVGGSICGKKSSTSVVGEKTAREQLVYSVSDGKNRTQEAKHWGLRKSRGREGADVDKQYSGMTLGNWSGDLKEGNRSRSSGGNSQVQRSRRWGGFQHPHMLDALTSQEPWARASGIMVSGEDIEICFSSL